MERSKTEDIRRKGKQSRALLSHRPGGRRKRQNQQGRIQDHDLAALDQSEWTPNWLNLCGVSVEIGRLRRWEGRRTEWARVRRGDQIYRSEDFHECAGNSRNINHLVSSDIQCAFVSASADVCVLVSRDSSVFNRRHVWLNHQLDPPNNCRGHCGQKERRERKSRAQEGWPGLRESRNYSTDRIMKIYNEFNNSNFISCSEPITVETKSHLIL